MAENQSIYSRSFRSFSGVDITATFSGKRIGTLQGVSYTVTREKAPQYTMGKADPISFSRGKRGIAGSLIFLLFDRSNLVSALDSKFWADSYDIRADSRAPLGTRLDPVALPTDLTEAYNAEADRLGGIQEATPWYHDQIPPFTIVLTAATEYGQVCRMAIHNVEILNAGSGISIDDITTDENMTFVATDITPWKPIHFAPGINQGSTAGLSTLFTPG